MYYDVDASGASLRINLKQIFEALQDAERKDLQPKSSLNMAQRFSEVRMSHTFLRDQSHTEKLVVDRRKAHVNLRRKSLDVLLCRMIYPG